MITDKHDRLSVFYPPFIAKPEIANVSHVADHIEHIASVVGKNHVGIASDFDGMYAGVHGLEDASKYPNLVCLDCTLAFVTHAYLCTGSRASRARMDRQRNQRRSGRKPHESHGRG